MHKNIKLLYLIYPLCFSWFWLGVWAIYYLRFTNYQGIGLIETVAFSTAFALEIPTGAITDMFGRKKSLVIALLLESAGNINLAFSHSLTDLLISICIMGVGGALISGTIESLLYDSLKETASESLYAKLYAKMGALNLVAMAASGFVGGFLYKINPAYPFFLTGLAYLLGAVVTLFTEEPHIKKIPYSFANYINQNKQGFRELFKDKTSASLIVKLLGIYSLAFILTNIVDNALAINFRFSEAAQGIIFSIATLASALGNYMYSKYLTKTNKDSLTLYISVTLILSLMLYPLISPMLGVLFIMYRFFFYPVIDVISSDTVNKTVGSEYRATTLSTFAMINKFPYVVTGILVGYFIDKFTSVNVAFYMSWVYALILTFIYFFLSQTKNENTII